MNQKAVIYARYSSSKQRDVSIEQQIEACRKYADANGLDVIRIYEDRAMTGTNDNRPGFRQMIRDSATHAFTAVIVYTLDRFSRNKYDAVINKKTLKDNGVRVQSAMEHITDDPTGALMESILEGFAEYYSQELSQKIRRGVLDNARKGIAMGILPFGYRRGEDGKYEVDTAEAPIVNEIFTRTLHGEPFADIFRDLNARGILTRKGKPWSRTSLDAMLTNEKYIGNYKHGSSIVENCIPPILDRDLFFQVQELLKQKKNPRQAPARRRTQNGTYLLTGKIFCGECKQPMIGVSANGRGGVPYFYYVCKSNHQKAGSCKMTRLQRDPTEYAIASYLSTVFTDPTVVSWLADEIEAYLPTRDADHEVQNLRVRLDQAKREQQNTLKAIRNGVTAPSVMAMLTDIETQIDDLAIQLALAESAAEKQITRGDILAFIESFQSGDLSDKRYQETLIDSLLRRVYVYTDRLVIFFSAGPQSEKQAEIKINPDTVDSSTAPGLDVTMTDVSYNLRNSPQTIPYTNHFRLMITAGLMVLVSGPSKNRR